MVNCRKYCSKKLKLLKHSGGKNLKLNQIKLLSILFLSFLIFVAGCSDLDSEAATSDVTNSGEKVLKVGLVASPGNIDPHFAGTHAEYEVVQPIFNGLLRFEPGTASLESIEGDLAESWKVSEDGLC